MTKCKLLDLFDRKNMGLAMKLIPDVVYLNRQKHRYSNLTQEQRDQLRERYQANVPGWRRSGVGYFMTIPMVGLIILCTQYFVFAVGHLLFASTLYILIMVIVALLWGVGPATFALVLSSLALVHFFIEPLDAFLDPNIGNWEELVQLIPFVVSGFIVALITSQREAARLQTLVAEQELQRYADSLEEADKDKDRFISIASHELKTPITTIRGQAQLTLRRLSRGSNVDLEGIKTTLEHINDQTGRLTTLVDELLDVSTIRAGKVHLNIRSCNICELCGMVVDDQRLMSNREITLNMSDCPIILLVDSDRLSQVLTNLITNAVKYSPEDQPVEVTLQKDREYVRINVRDYGRGIAKDQQQRIFENFYRTPDAQSSSMHGLGLGLAITRDIVERHHGRIWVDSEEGHGSVFHVELPLVVNDIPEAAHA